MKKFLAVSLTAALLAGTAILSASCGNSSNGGTGENGTLSVYNWGEYISDGSDGTVDTIAEIEKRLNCSITYDLYSTNEEMFTKIQSGAVDYDVIIPSDYMISRMLEADMLEKLDFTNIPNAENLMDKFKKTDYDPTGEYSVAYTWGTVGLIYNTTIFMFSNSRDAFGIALKLLGYSQNTTDEAEIREAADLLKAQKPVLQAYVMDEIFDKMEIGEGALAPYYAGDAVTMISENEDLAYVLPKEGSNVFIDAMCIPKGASNKELAEKFINEMCSTDLGLANIEKICYSTPLQNVYDALDDETKNNPIIYPDDATLAICESFINLPEETNILVQDLWNEIITE